VPVTIQSLTGSVTDVVGSSLAQLAGFIPRLVGGLVILAVGLIIAVVIHRAVVTIAKVLKVEAFLKKYGIAHVDGVSWSEVVAELARWAVIVIFLIPVFEAWGISGTTNVLNQILGYIPNVVVAVIIGVLGLVFARLAHDVTYSATRSLGDDTAHTASLIARWAIVVFTALVVLNQLGIAQDLIRILFTGLVGLLALAGGLAFGLGGQDTAREILNSLKGRFKK